MYALGCGTFRVVFKIESDGGNQLRQTNLRTHDLKIMMITHYSQEVQ